MPRQFLSTLVFAAGTCLALHATMSYAQGPGATAIPSDGTLLSISAQAEASRVPDVANVSTGVVTQAADANAALRANSAQMQKVMAAIRAAGVAEKDVQTSGINVNPQYRYVQDQPPAITGYQANNTVSIKVRDIAKLGDVFDAMVASGANQVNGPSFEIDEPESVYDEARRAALGKARQRADMYAKALGVQVRRIVSISEGGGFANPMPMMRMQAEAKDAMAAPPPVSPGQSTLSVNIDVIFELGR